ncbi:ComEA family DNA-binding protein [Candidatus Microgenomates bacterium]|jgi:competence protein ComEA|nr:MAG: ComEA family DNA-binding protein [Candidatus Microgenomates bacterium]
MEIEAEGKNKALGLFLAGVFLIGAGFLIFKISSLTEKTEVEIFEEEPQVDENEVLIAEIAGEVINPGVYELKSGSRVNDLLIKGGGYTAKADRQWVSRNINLAMKLEDGTKIFIPAESSNLSNLSNLSNSSNLPDLPSKINVNTASVAELDTLWGVGEATAKKIIEGRPYQKPEELLEKKIVKSNVWEAIKDEIKVY